MKKVMLLLSLAIGMIASSQTYVSGSFSHYDGKGTFSQQGQVTVEVGRVVHDVATLGVAMGTTSLSHGKAYTEFRPTLTIWSHNQFSLCGTLGAGYVFDSSQSFLTEYCGTACYTFKNNVSLSIFGGGYKFNGRNSFSKYTFVGTGVTYTFQKSK